MPYPTTPSSTLTPTPSSHPISRSQRTHQKLAWLTDFVYQLDIHSFHLVITGFSPAYLGFVASLSLLQEPTCYRQVFASPQGVDAMNQELLALEHNETWEVVPLPAGKQPIRCKWIFKVPWIDMGPD